MIHKSRSLKYEPSSESLHISPRNPHRRSLISNAAHPPVQRLLDIQDTHRLVVVGETCLCGFHPLGWLRASALTFRLISLVGVKWSCLRINKQASPPLQRYLGNKNLVRAIISYKHSGSMKTTTHLDRMSHCKSASGTNWSNRWSSRVFIINAHRDLI